MGMPSSSEILALATESAHRAIPVAIAWHLIVLLALGALVAGWRPSARRAGELLALPLLSVGLVSLATGNPFNGIVFGVFAVGLAQLARHGSRVKLRRGSPLELAAGAAMIAVAWVYPHFLDDLPMPSYFYAAPIGVVPCATLYLVIGFALLGPVGTRAWRGVAGSLGVIYGTVGVFLLGVWLDVGLIVGGIALAALSQLGVRRPAPPSLTAAGRSSP